MNTQHSAALEVKQRLAIVLASAALAVALFGSTPIGNAVASAVSGSDFALGVNGDESYRGSSSSLSGTEYVRAVSPLAR